MEEFANFGGDGEDEIGDEQALRLLEEEAFEPAPDLQVLLEVRPGDRAVAAGEGNALPAADRLVFSFHFSLLLTPFIRALNEEEEVVVEPARADGLPPPDPARAIEHDLALEARR